MCLGARRCLHKRRCGILGRGSRLHTGLAGTTTQDHHKFRRGGSLRAGRRPGKGSRCTKGCVRAVCIYISLLTHPKPRRLPWHTAAASADVGGCLVVVACKSAVPVRRPSRLPVHIGFFIWAKGELIATFRTENGAGTHTGARGEARRKGCSSGSTS